MILPIRASERDAERALNNRADWVLKSLKRWEDYTPQAELDGRDGDRIGYLGGTLRLTLLTHDRARTRIDQDDEALTLYLDERLDESLRAATVKRAVDRWRTI